jgi:xanthine dehydrogenase YagS FAD-binding subunit
MRAGIADPLHLVDLRRANVPETIHLDAGGRLTIGASAKMSDVAAHPIVRERCPVLAQALLASASAQVRNAASIGGNLMQRTRCAYFRDTAFACNKRNAGSGCPAQDGDNRRHAIFGGSSSCVAVHASDLAVALIALDANLRLQGPDGERRLPLADFYLDPGDTPWRETMLAERELILAIDLPPSAEGTSSAYIKVRDRASFEFALVAAGVVLRVEAGIITKAAIALGGVAPRPWRLPRAEARLIGQPLTRDGIAGAVRAGVADARPLLGNAFKIELACRTAARAIAVAGGLL